MPLTQRKLAATVSFVRAVDTRTLWTGGRGRCRDCGLITLSYSSVPVTCPMQASTSSHMLVSGDVWQLNGEKRNKDRP
ncbi:hypothetical protein EDD36DRAFT_444809 [Exophiala viscosa]|uniref:Uncharacterized protein n=1 Tax=Exophiala viscosa TaxID=2486360 RepID=A0AAN6IBL9_9EURO|nr:hypothetical protein EDD36DRAFT_444809 [Exophiala viscosa]